MGQDAIFISYRRDDTADVAGRLYDVLSHRFGRHRIFKDVDNLQPGADFGADIRWALSRTRAMLVLIGPQWIDARDETGARRLDDPSDWVRLEVEIALDTPNVEVIPALINGASMPRGTELPPSLQPLLNRHAATIRRDPDFHADVARLELSLRQGTSALGDSAANVQTKRRVFASVATAAVALAMVTASTLLFPILSGPSPDQTSTAELPTTTEGNPPTEVVASNEPSRPRTPAVSETPPQQLSELNDVVDRIITREAYGWMYNRYDRGSATNTRLISQTGDDGVIQTDYTYNDGIEGWVRIRIVDGRPHCAEYHDFVGNCRPLGVTAGGPAAEAFRAAIEAQQ